MKQLLLLIAMMYSFSSAAEAAEAHDAKCDSPMQPDLMECMYHSYDKADKKLNILYQKLVAAAKAADQGSKASDDAVGSYEENLRASEKAWMAFRDAECVRTSSANRALYGQEGDFDYPACLQDMTNERIKQLSAPNNRGTTQ